MRRRRSPARSYVETRVARAEQVRDGEIPWWSRAGEIVLLNLEAEKPLGYHRDELVGRKIKRVVAKGFAERLVADSLPKARKTRAGR